nr:acyl-CoA thioesterase [Anaerolineae bacterium]
MPEDIRPLYTESTFHVRYAETDMMGVVHHSQYIIYMEEGRSALSRKHNIPYSELEAMGYSLALSAVKVRYHAPARYDDLVTVCAWVKAIQSRGITFGYEIVDAGSRRQLVTGITRHICVDRECRVCQMPPEWVNPLKQTMQEQMSSSQMEVE